MESSEKVWIPLMLEAFMNEFMRLPFDLAAHRDKAERWTEALRQGEEYRTKGRDNAVKSMQQARILFFSIYSAQTADFAFFLS